MSGTQIAFRNRDWEFAIYNRDNEGDPVNITGSSWAFNIRALPGATPVLTATPAIMGPATNGQLSVIIVAANMTMTAGNYYAELYRTDAGIDVNATWDVVIGDEGEVFGSPGDVIIQAADELVIVALNAPVALVGGAGGVTDSDKGDITVTGGGTVWTVDPNAITFAKIQDIPTDTLVGRDTAGSGDPESITLNATLSFNGSLQLQRAALTGDVTSPAGSNAMTLQSTAVIVLASSAGTDTYTATSVFSQAAVGYVTNRLYLWPCPTTNTGPATLNIDGLGAKSLVKVSSIALIGGDVRAGNYYWLLYNGTNLLIVGSNAVI